VKRPLLLPCIGALISLTSCTRSRPLIPAGNIQRNIQAPSVATVVFQLDHEPFSLGEDVYYSGNIEISASNPLRDNISINLASGYSLSGDTVFAQGGTVIFRHRGNPFEFNEITAMVIYSGDTISGTFTGVADSAAGSNPYANISGTFSNVPPQ
jgi:hypothetical protein